jgi:hypothetical protein
MFWNCFGRAHYKREAEIKSVRKETPCGKQSHKAKAFRFLLTSLCFKNRMSVEVIVDVPAPRSGLTLSSTRVNLKSR